MIYNPASPLTLFYVPYRLKFWTLITQINVHFDEEFDNLRKFWSKWGQNCAFLGIFSQFKPIFLVNSFTLEPFSHLWLFISLEIQSHKSSILENSGIMLTFFGQLNYRISSPAHLTWHWRTTHIVCASHLMHEIEMIYVH